MSLFTKSITWNSQDGRPEHLWSAKLCKIHFEIFRQFRWNYQGCNCSLQRNMKTVPKDKDESVPPFHTPWVGNSLFPSIFGLQSFANKNGSQWMMKPEAITLNTVVRSGQIRGQLQRTRLEMFHEFMYFQITCRFPRTSFVCKALKFTWRITHNERLELWDLWGT